MLPLAVILLELHSQVSGFHKRASEDLKLTISSLRLLGQSAGANSVAAQMLADGGKTEGLFRAAIMQSGSQGLSPRFHPTSWTRVFIYGLLLAQTKCWGLKCLREKSAMELLEAHANMVRITSIPAVSWVSSKSCEANVC